MAMTDEFGFELDPSKEWEAVPAACPGRKQETVSRFSRYTNSVPLAERPKIQNVAQFIMDRFRRGCRKITVRLVGHADRDLVKERKQPGFLMAISRQRANAVKQAIEAAIRNAAITSGISWNVVGMGASSLVVPDPENKPESEQARNRRVEITVDTGAIPVPPTPKPITQDIKVVGKSFINAIGARIGATACSLVDPTSQLRLGALAAATQGATGAENPFTDAKDKVYRLFSSQTFTVTCLDGRLVSVIPSVIDTDVGLECLPSTSLCLTPSPIVIVRASAAPSGPSTFDFSWTAKGRPHPAAEPGFQLVCPRASFFIWHAVEGRITCNSSGISVAISLRGSQFPSHRVFVSGRLRATVPQGVFSNLWVPSPADITLVA